MDIKEILSYILRKKLQNVLRPELRSIHNFGLASSNSTYYNFCGDSKLYVILTNDLGTKDVLQMVFDFPHGDSVEKTDLCSVPAVFCLCEVDRGGASS